MNKIEELQFWCHKILPLVYEESLSYYEFLCKVNAKLNETIETMNKLIDEVDGIIEYVDKNVKNEIARLEQKIDDTEKSLLEIINNNDTKYNDNFDKINTQFNNLSDMIVEYYNLSKYYTDKSIEKAKKEIYEYVDNIALNTKVFNYFTGKKVTIQDMFNFLCSLHLENALTFNQLKDKNIIFNELANKQISYTQLALNGNILL